MRQTANITTLKEATKRRPDDAAAANALGLALRDRDEHNSAAEYFRRAILLDPAPEYHFNLATILVLSNWESAIPLYKSALRNSAYEHQVTAELAWLYLLRAKEPSKAAEYFGRLALSQPDVVDHHVGLARCYLESRDLNGLVEWLAQQFPKLDRMLIERGVAWALEEHGQYTKAGIRWKSILARVADDEQSLLGLGRVADAENDLATATLYYKRAYDLQRKNPKLLFKYISHLLRCGEYQKAGQVYRHGCLEAGAVGPGQSAAVWDSAALEGKRILVHSHGGYGDALQFARFAVWLQSLGAEVILECKTPLIEILSTIPNIHQVVAIHDREYNFDYNDSLWLVGLKGPLDQDWLTRSTPYLEMGESRSVWESRIPWTGSLRVGMVWRGNPLFEKDPYRFRSVSLLEFAPLFDLPNTDFYGLQKGPGERELCSHKEGKRLISLSGFIDSFFDTACAVQQLDAVVTVDTSVAHLAGALGKPVLLLLPYSSGWRWMSNCTNTPWYSSMQLFRQSSPGNWGPVVLEIRETLRSLGHGASTFRPTPNRSTL